jgi:hypothetical protein
MKAWKRPVLLSAVVLLAGLYLWLRLRPGAVQLLDVTGLYLGQTPPGTRAERFAPGILPRDLHSAPAFSPDGTLVYWKAMEAQGNRLSTSRQIDGRWTAARSVALGLGLFDSDDPSFSADGQTLYFTSWRPVKWYRLWPHKERIWYVEPRSVEGRRWRRPQPVSDAVNAMDVHWQFSVAESGALYFSSGGDLYRAPLAGGQHAAPQRLGPAINSAGREGMPFVAPDERYLLFSSNGQAETLGAEDLYVSFRQADGAWSNGSWSAAVNLGPTVNSAAPELCPRVSPDGEVLFFLSGKSGTYDAYWIDAGLLAQLAPGDE